MRHFPFHPLVQRDGPDPMSRRHFLKCSAVHVGGALVLAMSSSTKSAAIGPRSQTGIGQIVHRGQFDPRPEALRRLLWETGRRTSIDVSRDAQKVKIDDAALFHEPLLVLAGEGDVPPFTAKERALLVKHLRMGGLLWIDAPSPGDPFVTSMERELAAMFPKDPLVELKRDHVLMKSFYLVEHVVGRTDEDQVVRGIELGDRLAVLFTRCDVLGAMERDRVGNWRFDCTPNGERQRERAFRFGVNVMMYATCLDYKEDQVHIPFIMKKKRR